MRTMTHSYSGTRLRGLGNRSNTPFASPARSVRGGACAGGSCVHSSGREGSVAEELESCISLHNTTTSVVDTATISRTRAAASEEELKRLCERRFEAMNLLVIY